MPGCGILEAYDYCFTCGLPCLCTGCLYGIDIEHDGDVDRRTKDFLDCFDLGFAGCIEGDGDGHRTLEVVLEVLDHLRLREEVSRV